MRPSSPAGLRRLWRTVLCAAVISAAMGSLSAQQLTPVRFTLNWRFEGPAAPFTVALEKGYFKAEGLDVTIEPASSSREAITRVASGAYDMGIADVNTLVRLRDEKAGNDVKAVMVFYDRPPFAIIGRRSRGITKDLSSLKGKTLGAPAADSAFAQWPIFKAVNKIDDKEWKIGLETIGFPVREPMLAQGELDGVFGFAMSSLVNLRARGVPEDDIVVLLMSDYGLELYGDAVIASPKFLAQNPEAVRGFLRALIRGLRDTIADPAAAVETILKRNDLARKDVELERLRMALEQNILTPWVKENGIGGIDRERFETALGQIGLAFPYRQKPKVEDVFDDRFLPPASERMVN